MAKQLKTDLNPDTMLSRRDAAAWLRANFAVGSVSFLAKLAMNKLGPPHIHFTNRALYRVRDLEIWVRAQLRAPAELSGEAAR